MSWGVRTAPVAEVVFKSLDFGLQEDVNDLQNRLADDADDADPPRPTDVHRIASDLADGTHVLLVLVFSDAAARVIEVSAIFHLPPDPSGPAPRRIDP